MGSTNEDGGTNFRWTDEHEKIICELCIKFIRKNGRVSFKWIEINQEFEAIIKRKIHQKALKNKYDAMKRDWRSWKSLKFGETGLGWDPLTGKLSCSDEWWERKIKVSLFLIFLTKFIFNLLSTKTLVIDYPFFNFLGEARG